MIALIGRLLWFNDCLDLVIAMHLKELKHMYLKAEVPICLQNKMLI